MGKEKFSGVICLVLVCIFLCVFLPGCRGEKEAARPETPSPASVVKASSEAPVKKVFNSPLAGTWYAADEKELGSQIDGFLGGVEGKALAGVNALILPHAGYQWSGQTAAHGVKQVAGRTFSRVVVMGPSHQLSMPNAASVPDATHYSTPLGEIPLDVEFIKALRSSPHFSTIR